MKNEWLDRASMKQEIETLRAQVETLSKAQTSDALSVIEGLRNQLAAQQKEFETTLEQGYEEAYQMILAERNKRESLEVTLYEEYDVKLKEMKEYIVDKVHQFLELKSQEMMEANHDTAAFILQTWLKQTSARQIVEEAIDEKPGEMTKEELKAQVRILEAKNMRLSVECEKLRHSEAMAKKSEQEVRKVTACPITPSCGTW